LKLDEVIKEYIKNYRLIYFRLLTQQKNAFIASYVTNYVIDQLLIELQLPFKITEESGGYEFVIKPLESVPKYSGIFYSKNVLTPEKGALIEIWEGGLLALKCAAPTQCIFTEDQFLGCKYGSQKCVLESNLKLNRRIGEYMGRELAFDLYTNLRKSVGRWNNLPVIIWSIDRSNRLKVIDSFPLDLYT